MSIVNDDQLWIELAPHRGGHPNRLLVFLHGAGSSPEALVPLALAWQFKFPSAMAVVAHGLRASHCGRGRDWFEPVGTAFEQRELAQLAASQVSQRIGEAQQQCGASPASTAVVGFSQGAVLALQLALRRSPCASIVVAHAGRLLGPIPAGTRVTPSVHLLHGELDSLVPAQHSIRAYRALRAAGARVSLDITAHGIHSIGQDMVNVGTTRVMQTIYRDRKRIEVDQFRLSLAVSTDTRSCADSTTASANPDPNSTLH